ncbi:hypothetical protein COCOR_04414 [Corallococcus coralloides DSM 2259]|uniref:Uncharacterized protein n=2 Tax=Corallococcus coralloides TaxID=184914 RepID=H8MF95_CORCM|nr:hypothetical protein COCOR_04414 [Corallococcus coralloides DSM 2259]
MDRTLKLALSKYPVVPHTLRTDPTSNRAVDTLPVNLATLYHHYYLDSYGTAPPNPDPAQFEHVRFLMPTRDFRLQGSGIGAAPGIKRHRSTELGQAFCRLFLHDHFNITYFAHMEHILDRQLHRAFDGCRIERTSSGDAPDYFCAESVNRVFLAEAKGRYEAISFKSKEFAKWRTQFARVTFKDTQGWQRRIKGHIVAVRYATELDGPRIKSSIFAEDPYSPGERPLDGDDTGGLGAAVIASHYSGIAAKLRQPLLAASLATGLALPDELRILAFAWRVIVGPLAGRRFVGGFFGPPGSEPSLIQTQDGVVARWPPPIRLDAAAATFFGVEETIFRQVVEMARTGLRTADQLGTFEGPGFFYSGFSALHDGSVLGPGEFFNPEEQLTL